MQALDYVIEQINSKNPLHSKKLKKVIEKVDEAYFERANNFLNRYQTILKAENKTLDYSIECYLQMLADMNYEMVQFFRTGEYTSTSFEEVNKRVYDNPEVMEYYMHGLLLSHFLWSHHYEILKYFNKTINQNKENISNYLEVGGGHGLYISEAIAIIGNKASYDLLDISQSSPSISKKMVNDENVSYILSDIFDYNPSKKFDFIVMGEVLEHVEDPVKLLKKLALLLSDSGKLFITTPTNAPAIDHIYLFKNADDIRKVILEADFEIDDEFCIYSEDMPAERAEKLKVSMMYAGLLSKK
ncbi:MAG: 2-polyprenyl-3-methyl-5-hydroxy-6-metoxy-1,4-benzoquinol methylase [Psychroserpens sp.]